MSDAEIRMRRELRCLLVPLGGASLLVPNALVAEIINFRVPAEDQPAEKDWMLGHVDWRNLQIPVISYERMIDDEYSDSGQRRRIVVCHSLSDENKIPFIGIVAQGLPRLMGVDEESIETLAPVDGQKDKPIFGHVSVRDNPAFVPKMSMLGDLVSKA